MCRAFVSLLLAAAVTACSRGPGGAEAARIEVTEATYGSNCGARAGNATAGVARTCDRQLNCDYEIRTSSPGDPAHGCAKDFVVLYRCPGSARVRRVKVDAEAGLGTIVSLTCE